MRRSSQTSQAGLFRGAISVATLLAFMTQGISAQLLPNLLNTVNQVTQPLVTTVADLTCSQGPLSSSPKLDAALQQVVQSGSQDKVPVIVTASSGLLGIVDNLLLGLSSTLLVDLPSIDGVVATVAPSDLVTVVCSTSVLSVSIDANVAATADGGSVVSSSAPYSLRATLGLPQDTPGGSGVGVAIIDSGIASSADFGGRIAGFYDFTHPTLLAAPFDDYGHGTHVAGLIAGSGSLDASGVYQGLGPQVRLIAMKVLDKNGSGRTSDVIRAVELATMLRSILGIQVINLSLGHPIFEPASRDPLVRAVEAASRAGIVVVAAAGNYGFNVQAGQSEYGGIASPGNAPSAITVGAVMTEDTNIRSDDRVAPYSSRGPSWCDGFAKPDLVAPGHRLVSDAALGSTLYTTYPSAHISTGYLRLSGTSMATAVTTGAVALVLEANRRAHPGAPPLTPNTVKAILQYSSLPMFDGVGTPYDSLTQGAGALNAAGAISLAAAIDTRTPVGWYWWTSAVNPFTTVAGETWTWVQHLLWGSRLLSGSPLDTNQSAWTLGSVWGGQSVWGSHIVWGDDVVWGSNESVWSSHIVWGDNYVGTSTDGQHIVWGSGFGSTGGTAGDGSTF